MRAQLKTGQTWTSRPKAHPLKPLTPATVSGMQGSPRFAESDVVCSLCREISLVALLDSRRHSAGGLRLWAADKNKVESRAMVPDAVSPGQPSSRRIAIHRGR